MPKAIHKAGSVIVEIRIWLVGFELVEQGGKSLNIISDSRSLVDMEHLAWQSVILVTTKVLVQEFTEVRPWNTIRVCKGLNPASGSTLKVHAGHLDPPARRHIIHLKIILGLRYP
jgi:hypothetical protein